VLDQAGVFKRDPAGRNAFDRIIDSVKA